jgi:hypothetical protein
MSDGSQQRTSGFCIYIDTFFQGPVPTVFDEHDKLCIFATKAEAQREIADNAITRLEQFLSGERDFDDAMTVEEYIVAVDVLPDGSITDADGNHFSASAERI